MKLHKFTIVLFVFGSFTFLISCKKKDSSETTVFLGDTYFPMQVGDTLIYDAHVHTKDLNEYDSTYQILERVESIFTDNQGRPTFRLERYVRSTPADAWVILDVWTANINSVQVEKKEENITYIKLAFPTQLNKTWNGNAKNILDPQDYEITDIHQPLSLNNLSYDSTLTVTQKEEILFIGEDHQLEKYAAGVGMIYKELRKLDYSGGDTIVNEYWETLFSHN